MSTPASPSKLLTFLEVAVALILLQTLYFKFTGAEESRYIFETVGMEPHGRIGSAVAELIACILLLKPGKQKVIGAFLALSVISGALFFHLTNLGIEVKGDGGLLFGMAVFVFIASAFIVFFKRKDLPMIGNKL